MNSLIHFMNTWIGRIARILLGVAIMYAGFALVGGWVGVVVAAIGLLPIAFGIIGHCALEFFVRAPAQS
jgi:hypothetical protein